MWCKLWSSCFQMKCLESISVRWHEIVQRSLEMLSGKKFCPHPPALPVYFHWAVKWNIIFLSGKDISPQHLWLRTGPFVTQPIQEQWVEPPGTGLPWCRVLWTLHLNFSLLCLRHRAGFLSRLSRWDFEIFLDDLCYPRRLLPLHDAQAWQWRQARTVM